MDERRHRANYQLPATAMALGSSKMMSDAERKYVQSLISGGPANFPEPEFSEEAAAAARLAGLTLPAHEQRAVHSDDSSITSSDGDCEESEASHSSSDETAVHFSASQAGAALSSADAGAAAASNASVATHRVSKRRAECTVDDETPSDVLAGDASAERSAMSSAVAGMLAAQGAEYESVSTSKRPKRAAASRATELARQALLAASCEDDQDEEEEEALQSRHGSRGAAVAAQTSEDDDEDLDGTYTARRRASSHCSSVSCSASRFASLPTSASSSHVSALPRGGSSSLSGRGRGGSSKGRQLPEWSVHVLKEWLLSPEHFDYPWPTMEEKDDLAARAGIDERQLGIWLTNARKRLWMPLRRRQGLSIPRYSDAKSERVQRALVERVQHEAVKAGKDATVCVGSMAASRTQPQAAPATVNPLGLARVMVALRAEEAQLRADERALAAQRELVTLRSSWLTALRVSQQPSFLANGGRQMMPCASSLSATSGQDELHCCSSYYMQLPPSEHVMLTSVPPPSDPMQPDWDGSDLAADEDDAFGAFGLL